MVAFVLVRNSDVHLSIGEMYFFTPNVQAFVILHAQTCLV